MTKIRFELSKKHSKQEKEEQGKAGFNPAIARWVIERSNAWMDRCKILVKNNRKCDHKNEPLLCQTNGKAAFSL